ncbi:MAG: glycosyltransferase family A protein [Pseudomonadota bacterium]
MSTPPDISIIMPAYDAAATIADSVKSVQAQTLKNWELIIVDDGSADSTATIAFALADDDHRIRVICQDNQGPSAARNHGVADAKAQTIAFLDADDFWAPRRLTGMLSILASHPDIGVLFSRTRFVDAETLKPGTLTRYIADLTAADLMAENAVCSTSNIVCRKTVFEQIGGFAKGLDYAEDQDWLLRVALDRKWHIRGVDAEWFFYRSNEVSQSADLEAMRNGWQRMAASALEDHPVTAALAARRAVGPIHRQLARRALRLGQRGKALQYILIALWQDPLLLFRQPKRTALTLLATFLVYIPNQKIRELVAK